MKKVLYFDCFSGISGDMMVGALLDLGIDSAAFAHELSAMGLGGYNFEVRKTTKNAITGTDFSVILLQPDAQEERNLYEIEQLIERGGIKDGVKRLAKSVFREIAQAEATVHGKSIKEVHFHEIGAVDSIVDIVGAAICLDMLGVDEIYASELHEGKGFVETRHGRLPVPVPAVAQMMAGSGIPMIQEEIQSELVTPTGIGLIKTIASSFGALPPQFCVEKTGYGFGKRETGRLNALRVMIGTLPESESCDSAGDHSDDAEREIVALEANIDDMTPEALGYAMERLFANHALDVFFTPIQMKKNRPAQKLTVLAAGRDVERLVDTLFLETTTIGVRKTRCEREVMARTTVPVDLPGYGSVRVKVVTRKGLRRAAPEYDDCREIAIGRGLPLMEVYEMAKRGYEKQVL